MEILIDDVNTIWDKDRFLIVREPIVIKEFTDFKFFKKNRCLDMPIKMAKSNNIKLPIEYMFLKPIIKEAYDFEKIINKNVNNYYMYLTFHNSEVKSGNTQRKNGWHIDGMQGSEYPKKIKVCHSYLISDTIETEFAIQNFDVSDFDYYKDNWFKKLGNQVDSKNIKTYGFNNLTFMTSYQVHRCGILDKDIYRNFVRIEFSLKKFNRIGNTINPLIKTNWKYINRDIPKHLI